MASGTATIGRPLRNSTEVRYGSTLRIPFFDVPGTAGQTFVSNFRYQSLANSPDPVVGQLAGQFTVSIRDADSIWLTSPTDSLALGRYVYDVSATVGSVTYVSELHEFEVVDSQSNGSGSALPPASTTPQLIAQHNLDLTAHAVQRQSFVVSNADLVSGFATLTHLLATSELEVRITDLEGELMLPWIALNNSTVQVDFTAIAPITRQYTIQLRR